MEVVDANFDLCQVVPRGVGCCSVEILVNYLEVFVVHGCNTVVYVYSSAR